VGIGICGSIFTAGFSRELHATLAAVPAGKFPEASIGQILRNADSILRPEIQAQFPPDVLLHLEQAVSHGVLLVFWATLAASVACLICCLLLPLKNRDRIES
jgi:hypothetical protein